MQIIVNESPFSSSAKNDELTILKKIITPVIGKETANEQAKILLKEFGSIKAILGSDSSSLNQTGRIHPDVGSEITKIKQIVEMILKIDVKTQPMIGNINQVIDYYRAIFIGKQKQEFHMLFMNQNNRFMGELCLQTGTVNEMQIYPREIIKAAFRYNSSKFLIVRNQPSGFAAPNMHDIELVRKINRISSHLKLQLFEYIIIGENNDCSLVKGLTTQK